MRVGLKVGKVDDVASRREVNCHHLAVELGVSAKPVVMVMADRDPVAFPTLGISALPGVHETQRHRCARGPVQAKIKPLGEIAGVVAAQVELDVLRISQADDLDGAGIEVAGNVQCWHGGS